jgi:hypothetical protein
MKYHQKIPGEDKKRDYAIAPLPRIIISAAFLKRHVFPNLTPWGYLELPRI